MLAFADFIQPIIEARSVKYRDDDGNGGNADDNLRRDGTRARYRTS